MIPIHEISRTGKFRETERRLGITRGGGEEEMRICCLMVRECVSGRPNPRSTTMRGMSRKAARQQQPC